MRPTKPTTKRSRRAFRPAAFGFELEDRVALSRVSAVAAAQAQAAEARQAARQARMAASTQRPQIHATAVAAPTGARASSPLAAGLLQGAGAAAATTSAAPAANPPAASGTLVGPVPGELPFTTGNTTITNSALVPVAETPGPLNTVLNLSAQGFNLPGASTATPSLAPSTDEIMANLALTGGFGPGGTAFENMANLTGRFNGLGGTPFGVGNGVGTAVGPLAFNGIGPNNGLGFVSGLDSVDIPGSGASGILTNTATGQAGLPMAGLSNPVLGTMPGMLTPLAPALVTNPNASVFNNPSFNNGLTSGLATGPVSMSNLGTADLTNGLIGGPFIINGQMGTGSILNPNNGFSTVGQGLLGTSGPAVPSLGSTGFLGSPGMIGASISPFSF